MVENVRTRINAYLEFVMMRQNHVQGDKMENLAHLMLIAIMDQHADLQINGHTLLNASQWLMQDLNAKQIMIVNLETFAGN